MTLLRFFACCASALALASPCAAAGADPYPARPIRLVVPTPMGTNPDFVTRALGQRLATAVGQPVTFVNRPGKGGAAALELMATAPDGHTLLVATDAMLVANPLAAGGPMYEPGREFTPVALVGAEPYVIAVHPAFPAKDLKALVDTAKSKPGGLSSAFASSGSHLAAALLASTTGVELQPKALPTVPVVVKSLLAGQTTLTLAPVATLLPYIPGGHLRALAVTDSKRSPGVPDVPAAAESGFPALRAAAWFGIVGPPGMTPEAVSRLNAEIVKVLGAPDFRTLIGRRAVTPLGGPPDAFAELLQAERARWREVATAAKLEPKPVLDQP